MNRFIKAALRPVRSAARRAGLEIATVPGQRHWRAGVELLWHPFDASVRRVPISTVTYEGKQLQFLVERRGDWIQGHHLQGKFYAVEELEVMRTAFRGGAFVDVGANVGNHSIFAAAIIGAPRVIAFEPNPDAYRVLRCNIALNDLAGTIEHLPFGLSDHDGQASVAVPDPDINLGGARLADDPAGPVQLRRGDDLLAGEVKIGFLKIDVEGLEMQVLAGLAETIARCRPPMMVEVDDKNRAAFDAWQQQIQYTLDAETRPYNGMANLFLSPIG
ncbi:MAG: FkbM family methyltransferase [Sphingomicrobium sp.]